MKPRRFACVIAIVLAYTVLATQSFACTAFQLTSGDGSKIYFRSMEFGFPFNSNVLIIPRGAPYTGATPDGKPGLKWIAKYGAVGLNAARSSVAKMTPTHARFRFSSVVPPM